MNEDKMKRQLAQMMEGSDRSQLKEIWRAIREQYSLAKDTAWQIEHEKHKRWIGEGIDLLRSALASKWFRRSELAKMATVHNIHGDCVSDRMRGEYQEASEMISRGFKRLEDIKGEILKDPNWDQALTLTEKGRHEVTKHNILPR